MGEAEDLSALVGAIYDAALNPSLWPNILKDAAAFVGGSGGAVFVRDSARCTGDSYYDTGVEPHYRQLYFDTYIRLDPMNAAYLLTDIEEVTSNSLIVPYGEFVESRFYDEWARPQGWVDNVLAVLERSVTSMAAFVVFRHERDGLADDEARRRMRLIVPHVRRAVLIGKVIDLKTAEAASLADTLDGIGAGMFLVDAGGRIVHANAAGHAMLAAGDVLRLADGHLAASDPQVDRDLHEIIVAAGAGDAALSARGIALWLTAVDGDPHVAHILPLTSGARRQAGSTYGAAAALFVHKAAIAIPSPPEVIARTYRLTPSELRVLLAVVEVGGVPEVAVALGTAETTVRFHLRSLFEKTGTHRQADLVKLVAGFSNPFVG